jgi:hypothetical protein
VRMALRPTSVYIDGYIKLLYIFHFSLFILYHFISHYILFNIIMLSVNFFCNISAYDILAYITPNYIALIYYAKIVHLLFQFHAGKVGFSAVCQAMYS